MWLAVRVPPTNLYGGFSDRIEAQVNIRGTFSGIAGPAVDPGRPAIGAAVAIRLPDGRKRVAQVDGGSGNAGKRAPDVHLGLDTITEAPVEIRWRDPDGNPHEETLQLKAGWHTIRLGWPADRKGELR
jgi:enediyne biosynthesis protein E4